MLTDKTLRALKPLGKPYKRADDRGLYILVNPDGTKYWRFKYTFGGREKLLSMGTFPDTKLKLARTKRDDARELLAANLDPSAQRRAEKSADADTFEAVAREWLRHQRSAEARYGRSTGAPTENLRVPVHWQASDRGILCGGPVADAPPYRSERNPRDGSSCALSLRPSVSIRGGNWSSRPRCRW